MDTVGIVLIVVGSILGIGFIAATIHQCRHYREDDSEYELERR